MIRIEAKTTSVPLEHNILLIHLSPTSHYKSFRQWDGISMYTPTINIYLGNGHSKKVEGGTSNVSICLV